MTFNLKSADRMQMYLESAIIMDYLEFLANINIIYIDRALLEDIGEGSRLHVYIE
jgi:hypothetical protein